MTKREIIDGKCTAWNEAELGEEVFVVTGSDVAFYQTVMAWCRARVANKANTWRDDQISEAIDLALRVGAIMDI
jgi:hypothetical protein